MTSRSLAALLIACSGCGLVIDAAQPTDTGTIDAGGVDAAADRGEQDAGRDADADRDVATPDADAQVPEVPDLCPDGVYGVDDDGDGFIDEDCAACTRVTADGNDDVARADNTFMAPFATIQAAIDAAFQDDARPKLVCVASPTCDGEAVWIEQVRIHSGIHVDGSRDQADFSACPRVTTKIVQTSGSHTVEVDGESNVELSHMRVELETDDTDAEAVYVHNESTGIYVRGVAIDADGGGANLVGFRVGESTDVHLGPVAIVSVSSRLDAVGVDSNYSELFLRGAQISVTGGAAGAAGVECEDGECKLRRVLIWVDSPSAHGIELIRDRPRIEQTRIEFGCQPGERTGMTVEEVEGRVENAVIQMWDPGCELIDDAGLETDYDAEAFDMRGDFAGRRFEVWSSTIDAVFPTGTGDRCETIAIDLEEPGDASASWWHDLVIAVGGCADSAVIERDSDATPLPLDIHYNHFEMEPTGTVIIDRSTDTRTRLDEIMTATWFFTETTVGIECLVDRPTNMELRPGSPCIDGGDLMGTQPDIDFADRRRDGRPDIGAYEYQGP